MLDRSKGKDGDRLCRGPLMEETDPGSSNSGEDGRLLSRYGVWLMVGLCTPTPQTPIPVLGRLLGALCHWFSATNFLDGAGKVII